MKPLQLCLLFAWLILVWLATAGVPPEMLAGAAFVGGWISLGGLVSEMLDG